MNGDKTQRVLSEAQVAQIQEAARDHIEQHGFIVQDDWLLTKARERGATVDEASGRMRLPRALTAELLATLPSRYRVGNILGSVQATGHREELMGARAPWQGC